MRVVIALIIWTLCYFLPTNVETPEVTIIPAAAISDGDMDAIREDAYDDAWCEFTNLFNSYDYKLSKNGRSMINGKFVKMGNA